MNQKFFPTKENYFGKKLSPFDTNQRFNFPLAHSPMLTYYGLSPPSKDYNYYSPKRDSLDKNNKINSKKLIPNFNTSPSDFFNKIGNTNPIDKNNEENSKTLQEKMEPFV